MFVIQVTYTVVHLQEYQDTIFGYTSGFVVEIGEEGTACTIQGKNSFAICSRTFTE